MATNVLSALINIASFKDNTLDRYASRSKIRINAVGDKLEFYVKDALAGVFKEDLEHKKEIYSEIFSHQGSQNNPPDIMLRGGDAFEIKKIGSRADILQLNSSPPKNKLYAIDPRITQNTKTCENWVEKEHYYVIGYVKGSKIKYLFFVHGLCYAADNSTYEKLAEGISSEVAKITLGQGLQFAKTAEIGRINKVDLLGRTNLRIRGMWELKNPAKEFSNLKPIDLSKEFSLAALIKKSTYESYPKSDREAIEKNSRFIIEAVKVLDPNNAGKQMDAKLIKLSW